MGTRSIAYIPYDSPKTIIAMGSIPLFFCFRGQRPRLAASSVGGANGNVRDVNDHAPRRKNEMGAVKLR